MLGKHVPAAENLLAVGEMAHDRLGFALVRQRLGERAVAHPGRLQHQPIHEIGEGRLRDIDHQRLGDLVAPAGIGIALPGSAITVTGGELAGGTP